MTTPTQTVSPSARQAAAGIPSADTLAAEHALLMRDVTRRAAPVLALLDVRTWPHAELGTLTAFLRATVLRQASDEEVLLYPHDATTAPFAELSADHVRLHTLTTRLERAYHEPCAPQQLRDLVGELVSTLRRHLRDEREILAALADTVTDVPSAAALATGDQSWAIDDDGPVSIALDALPADQAGQLCIERLMRLEPGQSAQIHSGDAGLLNQIRRWLQSFDSARYGVEHAGTGSEHTLEVTRRLAS